MKATTQAPPFEEHFLAAHHGLRTALHGLLLSLGADPENPQEVSRRFSINRNLAWKVSRVIRQADAFSAYPQVPGASGMRIYLEAFRKHKAPPEALEAANDAVEAFEQMVELHAGDRATLELMLDSFAPVGRQSEVLEGSRKLAFRGNSGIWGVQGNLRLRSIFFAPNAEDPSHLDQAEISGLIQMRRFRRDATLPLFNKISFDDDGSLHRAEEQPLQPGGDESLMLMRDYCSSPLPSIKSIAHPQGTLFELAEGAVGNQGETTLVFGSFKRRYATRYRDESNEYGECFTDVNCPVKALQFDLFLHEDLFAGMELEACVYQGDPHPLFHRRTIHLPSSERIQELGSGTQRIMTPLMPNYTALIQTVYERVGWEPNQFRGFRFQMNYPSVSSSVVLRFPLPEAVQS